MEDQARRQGRQVKAVTLALDRLPRALAARDTRGRIKRMAEARTGVQLAATGFSKDLALLSRRAG